MEHLGASDVRAVLRFVGETFAASPPAEFRLHAISRLRSLVPADMSAWVETRAGRNGIAVVASPSDPLPDGPRRFARVREQHPLLEHFERTRDGRAIKLSDFFDRRQMQHLQVYQELFRPADVEHQISIALPSRGARLIRITLNRARGDFSERDRAVLNLIREHIGQAQRHASEMERVAGERGDLEVAAETAEVGVIVVRRDRVGGRAERVRARARSGGGILRAEAASVRAGAHVAYMSPLARRQLELYFGPGAVKGARLPDAITGWLRASARAPLSRSDLAAWRRALCVERDGARLEIHAQTRDAREVLVLRERRTRIEPRVLETLGLTRRQAEILAWLALGKTNAEIATILDVSPSTVARHVEAIFARLGVQSRTAAAAAAFVHMAWVVPAP